MCWPVRRTPVALVRSAGRWCSQSTPRPGTAATPSAARSGGFATRPPSIRPVSRSWRAGPTSGSASSIGRRTPGPLRSTPSASHLAPTPPPPRSFRYGVWSISSRQRAMCRRSSSLPATTASPLVPRSPRSELSCPCASALGASFTPIPHHERRELSAGRARDARQPVMGPCE